MTRTLDEIHADIVRLSTEPGGDWVARYRALSDLWFEVARTTGTDAQARLLSFAASLLAGQYSADAER